MMILSVEDIPPTESERKQIERGNCLNCYQPYSREAQVCFTRKQNGEIIWWHYGTYATPKNCGKRRGQIK